jgi:hypothetical protein
MTKRPREAPARFEIRGDLDRRAAEALRLELVWLARAYGVEIEEFLVEPVRAARSPRSA